MQKKENVKTINIVTITLVVIAIVAAALLIMMFILPGFNEELIEKIEDIASQITNYASTTETEEYTWDISADDGVSNVTATLSSDGVLNIYGNGNMKDYSNTESIPWYSVRTLIKQVVISEGVTSIGKIAFYECSSIQEITIPDDITSIGDAAFYECSSLQQITIPEGVTSIGDSAFRECSSLQEITIPSSVTSIEGSVFWGCSNLKNIKVDENNQNYCDENGVLYNKTKTEIIKYPAGKEENSYSILDTVVNIGSYAFAHSNFYYFCDDRLVAANGYSNLQEIIIPNGVTSIGEAAFDGCYNLQEIIIPSSVTSIGNRAFYACNSLQEIIIPDGVTELGDDVFHGCSNLKEITMPSTLTSIGNQAFMYCSSLKEIIMPSSLTSIGLQAFWRCSGLREIIIPKCVNNIGDRAFEYCGILEVIIIPSSVTSIGSKVFDGCKIIEFISKEKTVTELPEIIKRALDPNDILYSSEDVTFNKCNNVDEKIEVFESVPYSIIDINNGVLSGFQYVISYDEWDISKDDGESNITAKISKDGLMTIRGNGMMKDYVNLKDTPWYAINDLIKNIEIYEGDQL